MELEEKIKEEEKRKKEEIKKLAYQVMVLARDNLMINLRFLDVALAHLVWKETPNTGGIATDGQFLFYDSYFILKEYQKEPNRIARMLLHPLLHCIFNHSFQYDKMDNELWDLAADIAVENTILEMDISAITLHQDEEKKRKLDGLQKETGRLTAEKLYKYFRMNSLSEEERERYHRLFSMDDHMVWKPKEEMSVASDQWKKISERMKANLKSFAKQKSNADSIMKNLEEATKERYDYAKLLQQFTVMGESLGVNDEDFDYVFYTYGMETYGNMPLIEPLEYKEVKKMKEFVIVIDTSASCKGELVKAFLNKTYTILKGTENFFQKINVHIIQADTEVQSDTKITNEEDFNNFMQFGKLKGFGGTDFQPAFEYVDKLIRQGEFENLKGLIYFTDGYGIYPERMPSYDVIFAFLDEDEHRAPVPPWSIKVILDNEEIEKN